MTGRVGHASGPCYGRVRTGGDQARCVLLLGLLLGGCTGGQGPEAIGPLFSNMFGPANEGREPPPGQDGPYPNLGTVPPRPAVPDPAMRDALTAALAQERQRSRNPLDAEMRPSPPRPAGTGGDGSMPLRAPGPPPLAAAPRIPWEEPAAPGRGPAPAALPAPAQPRPGPAPGPAATPAPAPLPEMGTSPPPPPPAELLAPGAGPPPPPPAELLAPRPR